MNHNEVARLDRLTDEIYSYFDTRDPYVVPRREPPIEEHLMEMFSVIMRNGCKIVLNCLFNGKCYHATLGEERIARELRPGDVFHMTIIRRGKKWRVWHMSAPYEIGDLGPWEEELLEIVNL